MNDRSILEKFIHMHPLLSLEVLLCHASIFDCDRYNHNAREWLCTNQDHCPTKQHRYPLDVIDRFLSRKNIGWPRRRSDKRRSLIESNLFRHDPGYPDINSTGDYEPRKMSRVRFWLVISGTYFAVSMDIFIQNKFLRKDIVEIPFEGMTIETFANLSTIFDITEIFTLKNPNSLPSLSLSRHLLLSNHVDAYNRIVCNHPSRLRLIAWNFDHEHHLCLQIQSKIFSLEDQLKAIKLYLWHLSCCKDDLVGIYDQHENMEQILNYHHTSKHGMIFPGFLHPKPNWTSIFSFE